MLWLITENESVIVNECNLHEQGNKWEVWVRRYNGTSLKIKQSKEKEDVALIKEAIDYAIENNVKALRL